MLNPTQFCAERGISLRDAVAVLKEQYPGVDRQLMCKASNPEKYAIRLVNDAERLLEDSFIKTSPEARRPDRRRLPVRVQCRLSTARFEALQRSLRRDGFDTVQGGLAYLIEQYLKGGECDAE